MPANPFTDGRSKIGRNTQLHARRNTYKGETRAANVSGNRETQNQNKEE